MENQNLESVAIGAVVEARDGLVGTVVGRVLDPGTSRLVGFVVQNDNQDKQYTIPAEMVSGQIGKRVIHLNVNRDELVNTGSHLEVDTDTSNYGHPTPPDPQ